MLFSPAEIIEKTVENSEAKISLSVPKTLLLGVMAGAFIGLSAYGSSLAACRILTETTAFGLGKLVTGAVFSTGLMMVIFCGAELFTGNCLMLIGVLEGRATIRRVLRNWFFVYIGNFIGGATLALVVFHCGQFSNAACVMGGMTVKIAADKVCNTFTSNILLGLLCNFLVCTAVWMATAARDATGKIWATFFPIMLFVISGFEHSVANMYYITAGMLAATDPAYLEAARTLGVTEAQINALNCLGMWTRNLFPVTIGNMLGGCLCVAVPYWGTYRR